MVGQNSNDLCACRTIEGCVTVTHLMKRAPPFPILASSSERVQRLGDWLIYGENKFKDSKYQEAMEKTGFKQQTLRKVEGTIRKIMAEICRGCPLGCFCIIFCIKYASIWVTDDFKRAMVYQE